ncbi:unnamed protein product [Arctia plantaginis]|uniref:Sugar transporter SWEET n=1 Tax=Arctia plantaginis TaxID=874455 RepID=A0A8S1B2C8_ARCPL|nr:unnamed protein product [Arctia plantaginis]
MDALANVLQPYKVIVGQVTTLVTVIQMLSGTFLCWDIYKQGSTRGVAITPLLGGLVLNILNVKYGYIIRDDPCIQVSLLGTFLHLIYSVFYFQYTNEKMKVWMQFGLCSILSTVLIGYTQIEDPGLVEDRFGWIITVIFLTLIASPLSGLKTVIKNQSTEGMPFPIILSGAIVSFAWLVYGFILRNDLIVIQNIVALLLSSVQLLLFVIYPSKPKGKAKKTN